MIARFKPTSLATVKTTQALRSLYFGHAPTLRRARKSWFCDGLSRCGCVVCHVWALSQVKMILRRIVYFNICATGDCLAGTFGISITRTISLQQQISIGQVYRMTRSGSFDAGWIAPSLERH